MNLIQTTLENMHSKFNSDAIYDIISHEEMSLNLVLNITKQYFNSNLHKFNSKEYPNEYKKFTKYVNLFEKLPKIKSRIKQKKVMASLENFIYNFDGLDSSLYLSFAILYITKAVYYKWKQKKIHAIHEAIYNIAIAVSEDLEGSDLNLELERFKFKLINAILKENNYSIDTAELLYK